VDCRILWLHDARGAGRSSGRQWNAEFAARVCADVAPKLAVGDGLLLHKLPSDSLWLDFPRLSFEDWLTALPDQENGPISGLSRKTPLQILYTSGTTGDPKGVVLPMATFWQPLDPSRRHRSAICATSA